LPPVESCRGLAIESGPENADADDVANRLYQAGQSIPSQLTQR
jgi:hypothetical protein